MSIHFFSELIQYVPRDIRRRKKWILHVIREEGMTHGEINIVFTSKKQMAFLNRTYLKRTYDTDIIGFDYSEKKKISGDLFVGLEQVKENASQLGIDVDDEIDRVIVHGILHLAGYKDGTKKEKAIIREKEDYFLQKR